MAKKEGTGMGAIVELHQDQGVEEDSETTDLALFVRTSNEDLVTWNRQRIVDALVRETFVDPDTAEAISKEVEEFIFSTKITMVTAPLIRELVDSKLIERGWRRPGSCTPAWACPFMMWIR